MREEVLDKAKNIIAENMEDYMCGLFNTRNTVGDRMRTIYQDEDITIECCDDWEYYEVFGLTKEEFETLHEWYEQKQV